MYRWYRYFDLHVVKRSYIIYPFYQYFVLLSPALAVMLLRVEPQVLYRDVPCS